MGADLDTGKKHPNSVKANVVYERSDSYPYHRRIFSKGFGADNALLSERIKKLPLTFFSDSEIEITKCDLSMSAMPERPSTSTGVQSKYLNQNDHGTSGSSSLKKRKTSREFTKYGVNVSSNHANNSEKKIDNMKVCKDENSFTRSRTKKEESPLKLASVHGNNMKSNQNNSLRQFMDSERKKDEIKRLSTNLSPRKCFKKKKESPKRLNNERNKYAMSAYQFPVNDQKISPVSNKSDQSTARKTSPKAMEKQEQNSFRSKVRSIAPRSISWRKSYLMSPKTNDNGENIQNKEKGTIRRSKVEGLEKSPKSPKNYKQVSIKVGTKDKEENNVKCKEKKTTFKTAGQKKASSKDGEKNISPIPGPFSNRESNAVSKKKKLVEISPKSKSPPPPVTSVKSLSPKLKKCDETTGHSKENKASTRYTMHSINSAKITGGASLTPSSKTDDERKTNEKRSPLFKRPILSLSTKANDDKSLKYVEDSILSRRIQNRIDSLSPRKREILLKLKENPCDCIQDEELLLDELFPESIKGLGSRSVSVSPRLNNTPISYKSDGENISSGSRDDRCIENKVKSPKTRSKKRNNSKLTMIYQNPNRERDSRTVCCGLGRANKPKSQWRTKVDAPGKQQFAFVSLTDLTKRDDSEVIIDQVNYGDVLDNGETSFESFDKDSNEISYSDSPLFHSAKPSTSSTKKRLVKKKYKQEKRTDKVLPNPSIANCLCMKTKKQKLLTNLGMNSEVLTKCSLTRTTNPCHDSELSEVLSISETVSITASQLPPKPPVFY